MDQIIATNFFNINLFILIGGQLLYNIVLVLPYTDMNQLWVYVRKLRILPFENLDCIEKARPSDNEGVFMQYIYLLSWAMNKTLSARREMLKWNPASVAQGGTPETKHRGEAQAWFSQDKRCSSLMLWYV